MMAKPWTPEEVEALKVACADENITYAAMEVSFGRTSMALAGKVRKLGLVNVISRLCCTPEKRADWPEEQIARLRALASEGLSPRTAADRLGCGRTAVLNRAKEHGIHFKGRASRADAPEPAKIAFNRTGSRPPMEIVSEPAPPGGVTIGGLSAFTCRWPLGDARQEVDGLQRFCGARIAFSAKPARASYCACHGALAVAAVRPTKRPNVYDPSVIRRRTEREAA